MRRYGSNITVDGGHDDKFESLVLDLLEQISRRATGALILSEIAINSVRKVKIVPSVPPDNSGLDDPKNRGVAVDAECPIRRYRVRARVSLSRVTKRFFNRH
jgi:hypothetical protein